jgi:hypothetical protein
MRFSGFTRFSLFGAVGAASALLLGCGGGGGGSSSTQNALVQGRGAINELASGRKSADQQTLQQVLDLFLQALQQDPNSSEAHFGAAICLAGKIAEEVDGSTATSTAPPAPPNAPGKPGQGSSGGGTVTPPSPPSPPIPGGPPSPPAPPGRAAAQAAVAQTESGEIVPVPPGVPEPAPLPRHGTLGLFWNLDNSLASPFMLLHMLAPISDLRLGFMPYYGYPRDNAQRRQQMLDGLNTVVDHLAKVEADPGFSVTLPDVDSNGKTVTVGLPEVYLFDAYVQSLRAKIALSLAYIRDPGTSWTPPALTPTQLKVPLDSETGTSGGSSGGGTAGGIGILQPAPAALDKNKDGKLTPDEYLPPSPYLTLRDPKLLQTAQQAMLSVVDRENKGIDGVLARPVAGAFLIPDVPAVQTALGQIRDKVLPLIQQAATGPFTIDVPRWGVMLAGSSSDKVPLASVRADEVFAQPGSAGGGNSGSFPIAVQTEPLKVNLAAWFTNPPTDLKAFAPTFTLTDSGWPDSTKTSYPDPTFGGLFPDGLKDDLPF